MNSHFNDKANGEKSKKVLFISCFYSCGILEFSVVGYQEKNFV